MHVERVDERDSCWESYRPRYRVYFFERPHEDTSWTVGTFDVTGADVIDVSTWAEHEAGPHRLFAIALVVESSREEDAVTARRGLVWLVGCDLNGEPLDDDEARLQRRMSDRRRAARH